MFRTSYAQFFIVVFRETASTEHTFSVLFLFPVESSAKEQLGHCPNLMEFQTEFDPGKHFSSLFLKDQEAIWKQADWFWI
jgi:hypothetical protein